MADDTWDGDPTAVRLQGLRDKKYWTDDITSPDYQQGQDRRVKGGFVDPASK